MAYLAAAVVFVGLLCFLDLLLSLAIIRRLRQEQSQHPHPAGAPGVQATTLPVGTLAPEFTAITTTGAARTRDSLAGQRSVVAFFAAACDTCRTQLDDFADYARSVPGGAGQVLAVVSGDPDQARDIVRKLDGPVSIALEPDDSPTATAFSVWGFPSFYALDEDGRIRSAGMSVSRLRTAELV
jgi:peroxiredoxin